MAGTNLNFPYDSEIFNYEWRNTPDMVLLNMLQSGAVTYNSEIANMISNGSNFFTIPYYNNIGGDEGVYNGVNDIATTDLTGDSLSGTVYGRQKGWNAKSFIKDFNSGADPMAQITAGVARYWQKKKQERLIGLLNAIFGITGDADFALHTTDISTADKFQAEKMEFTAGATSDGNITIGVTASDMTNSPKDVVVAVTSAGQDTPAKVALAVQTALDGDADVGAFFTATVDGDFIVLTAKEIAPFDTTYEITFTDTGTTGVTANASVDATPASGVTDDNKVGVTSIEDACIKANGDNADGYSLAIMHSVVASRLANLQLLEYSKYTDERGITRNLPIGTINGKTVIINDGVPVETNATGSKEYTTFIMGNGAINLADAPVDTPSEMDRDPAKFGGQDFIYTRVREAMHPQGFSFKGDVTTDVGMPDGTFLDSASWERKMPAKSILMAKLVTNG